MNTKNLLFVIAAGLISSCSSIYKSGQTPDDVYYSPVRAIKVTGDLEKKDEEQIVRRPYGDRQILMRIHDPRWRFFADDYDAYYDPYRYGYSCGYYYNPYYYPSPVFISGTVFSNPKNTTPRMTNLGSYNYSNMVVMNQKSGGTRLIRSGRQYNNSNSGTMIRRIVPSYNSNSIYNNNNRPADNNSRTYSPSTNSNSGGSSRGSGSSGAPVSRPQRRG